MPKSRAPPFRILRPKFKSNTNPNPGAPTGGASPAPRWGLSAPSPPSNKVQTTPNSSQRKLLSVQPDTDLASEGSGDYNVDTSREEFNHDARTRLV